jgi:hypothetical protein
MKNILVQLNWLLTKSPGTPPIMQIFLLFLYLQTICGTLNTHAHLQVHLDCIKKYTWKNKTKQKCGLKKTKN